MSEMSLVLSEKFTAEDAASIRAELGRRLQVGKPVSLRQRSIDPPSVIQLLGEAAAWLPLVVAATAFAKSFFGTLGKKAADAAWERAAEWKENKDLEPLVDVVTALIAAADRVGGTVRIVIGLNIPDDYAGTEISTYSRDPMEVARILSAFVVRAEKIAATVKAEIESGDAPAAEFFLELEHDGSVTIRWFAGSDLKKYEKRIP